MKTINDYIVETNLQNTTITISKKGKKLLIDMLKYSYDHFDDCCDETIYGKGSLQEIEKIINVK